jgi:tRNA threonylcarbamoyladenosine biosynthesis protein TsaE
MTEPTKIQLVLSDPDATEALGAKVAEWCRGRGIVFLKGDLGAGKTTLVRGVLRSLGFDGSTKSPTYTLVEPYQFEHFKVYHFDLYRLGDPEELEFIGLDDYLSESDALLLFEWPERGEGWLPEPHIHVNLSYDKDQRRAEVILYQDTAFPN